MTSDPRPRILVRRQRRRAGHQRPADPRPGGRRPERGAPALWRRRPGDRRARPCRDPARPDPPGARRSRAVASTRSTRSPRPPGPGLIGGVMVALLAGKGLALATGKPLIAVNHLEGHALSPRLVDPDLDFPYLLLLVSGGHCQLLEVRGVGDYRRLATTIDDAAGEAFDKAAKLLGLAIPAARRSRRWPQSGDPAGGAAAAAAGRLGRAAFLLRRPQERGPARGRVGRASARGHRRQLPAGGGRLPRRPHRAARCEVATRPALVVAGGVAANRSIRAALAELARRERPPLQRPAGLAVHRQCGDDRLGRGRAAGGRPDRRARRSGAGALAARRSAEKVRGAGVKA